MYKQLVTPNPDVPCRPGWCLAYVQDAFNTAHLYPNARVAWEQAKLKHTDVPKGIWVPIYFDDLRITEDHIAILAPDGSVYSSSHPTSTKAVKHKSISDTIAYYGYNLVYRGWSEDMAGTIIVKKENIMITLIQLYILMRFRLGRIPKQNEVDEWVGKKPFDEINLWILNTPEFKANVEKAKVGKINPVDYLTDELLKNYKAPTDKDKEIANLKKKIADLENKIKDLEKQGTFVKVSHLYIKK